MLQLDHDIDQLSLTEQSNSSTDVSPTAHSAPVTPCHNQFNSVDYTSTQGGFFEGLLGCLRPVWTMIGKAAVAEMKKDSSGM